MLYVHIGIVSMRQFQCVPTTYVTENKENDLEIYTLLNRQLRGGNVDLG